jgi:RNA polymerase sigma-70 factor (ECF subfamily)
VSADAERRAGEAVERAARLSYGRLVAMLSARTRDLAAAEDALSGALVQALERWPADGVPANPEAWLMTVARRAGIDSARRAATSAAYADHLRLLAQERADAPDPAFPDERLKLLFVCTHPAIDEKARTPLMLQTVLGVDARRIASAFLVAPSAMGQRLARAKAKIRDGGIGFDVPAREEWSDRVGSVLDAIYAGFTLGWDSAPGGDAKAAGLAAEAIWLGRLVAELLPDAAEAQGLLALMLFVDARAAARRDAATGAYVPLAEQDASRWSHATLRDAEAILARAGRLGSIGRYQLEAAIQAVHADRRRSGAIRWDEIALLYRGLVAISPTVGARIGLAVALGECEGPGAGLAILEAIAADRVADHLPYWAARAHLLSSLDRRDAAIAAYDRAAGLAEDAAVRAFLLRRRNSLAGA